MSIKIYSFWKTYVPKWLQYIPPRGHRRGKRSFEHVFMNERSDFSDDNNHCSLFESNDELIEDRRQKEKENEKKEREVEEGQKSKWYRDSHIYIYNKYTENVKGNKREIESHKSKRRCTDHPKQQTCRENSNRLHRKGNNMTKSCKAFWQNHIKQDGGRPLSHLLATAESHDSERRIHKRIALMFFSREREVSGETGSCSKKTMAGMKIKEIRYCNTSPKTDKTIKEKCRREGGKHQKEKNKYIASKGWPKNKRRRAKNKKKENKRKGWQEEGRPIRKRKQGE